MALRKLREVDVNDVSEKMKVEVRKKIETEITELRRTKKPIMRGRMRLPPSYPPEQAKRIREANQKGSLEELTINLNK
jgi:hypothetical protein